MEKLQKRSTRVNQHASISPLQGRDTSRYITVGISTQINASDLDRG
jgi:hypothetical protein